MIKGIDHIAIAVENLDEAIARFADTLGMTTKHRETIDGYGVEVATVGPGLELVAPTTTSSPIRRHIDRRGEGFHHIALAVDDIDAEIAVLKARSVEMIDETPRPGKQGSRVAFIHPRSMGKVLVELVEKRDEP